MEVEIKWRPLSRGLADCDLAILVWQVRALLCNNLFKTSKCNSTSCSTLVDWGHCREDEERPLYGLEKRIKVTVKWTIIIVT
jgi:hypothetical protein